MVEPRCSIRNFTAEGSQIIKTFLICTFCHQLTKTMSHILFSCSFLHSFCHEVKEIVVIVEININSLKKGYLPFTIKMFFDCNWFGGGYRWGLVEKWVVSLSTFISWLRNRRKLIITVLPTRKKWDRIDVIATSYRKSLTSKYISKEILHRLNLILNARRTRKNNSSPRWDLSPRPSMVQSDALPLSYWRLYGEQGPIWTASRGYAAK